MGRRKQIRPRRTGVAVEGPSESDISKDNAAHHGKDEFFATEEPFFVEIDKSSWLSEEHYDISEIVLLNLTVNDEFCGYNLTEEFYRDCRCFLRFKLSNVNEHLLRMKLGNWPVLPESDICLQFVMKCTVDETEREVVMVSGSVDGTDEGVTGLVHLASLRYLSVRPVLGIEFLKGMSSISVRVEILGSLFDVCESLLDNTRQLWKRSMMNVMAWLRPEVVTSEARYGYSGVTNVEVDEPLVAGTDPYASRQQVKFEVSSFYEAIKPSKEAPILEDHLPDLLPELRPYQRRAAYWMVKREKGDVEHIGDNERSQIISPLCMPLNLINTSRRIYYNPFSGNVSLHATCRTSYVSGGILADEMGLGKTIEVLSCIFAHRMPSSEAAPGSDNPMQVERSQNYKLKRLKRERVECLCGAVTESYKYRGVWVQCDLCDAWQHADCVGYSVKRKTSKPGGAKLEEVSIGNSRKSRKRKKDAEVVEMDKEHICQTCSSLMQAIESPIAAGATLIVCPTPILLQWHAEILRHTNPDSLKICIYGGVKQTSFSDEPVIDIDELLTADVVLTTYDVLKEDLPHDSERHEGDRRTMRYMKRYPVVPTLLTRILWWRICLDEAQMVEGNAASATELALRLHAKHRWCITGTPIQRKLDDLYGLLRFLGSSPFDVLRWWTDVISNPYERGDAGAITFTHNFFKQLMWRSSKAHVWDELQLPPQEESVSWLSFSPIEEHFYQRQHETCVDDAREVVESFKDDLRTKPKADSVSSDASTERYITSVEASKLFNSLLKLRQACCHPQVGSSGLRSLQKSPMTMEEILSVLIGKTKVEGEEALRKLVVALNGLAGISMIKQDFPQAVSLYKEALDLVKEHSDDFRLDPLLNIHIYYNLAEALPLTDNSSLEKPVSGNCEKLSESGVEEKHSLVIEKEETSRCNPNLREISDDLPSVTSSSLRNDENFLGVQPHLPKNIQWLRIACEDLKQKFLSLFTSKLSLAQQEFRRLYGQVSEAFTKRKHQHATWWIDALHQIEQNNDLSSSLIQKIGEALTGNSNKKSRIPACFRSITTLKYYLQTGLDALEESRKTLIDRILEIDQTMENPREEDIARVRYCKHCNSNLDGPACTHCELDEIFQVYEARLFRLNKSNNGEVITSVEEAVNLQKKQSALNQFYWNLSRDNKTSDYGDNGKKRELVEKVTVSKSPSDSEIVLTIIRNNSRGFLERDKISAARKQLDLLELLRKEYAMARSLAISQAHVLRAHDEIKMATSRLRLRENEDDKLIDALSPEELDTASVENSGEKFLAMDSLSRIKGQLRYLKGLVQSTQNVKAGCLNTSTVSEAIVPMENGCTKVDGESCPVCQEQLGSQKMVFQCGHVTCCKCLFAMTERGLISPGKFHHADRVICPTCRRATDFGNIAFADDKEDVTRHTSDKNENSVTVQGSYSTKIEAVTRRILWIISTDPREKILVFSSWNDVLDVLQHAFTANHISFVRMKGGRKSQIAISTFTGQKSSATERKKEAGDEIDTKSPKVLLLLIQHGANGLNLLEAQHVILVEPLLNPAAEAQAVGRVHRIGQKHKTLVHRFIVKDTVEESLYKLNKSRNTSSFISGNRRNQDHPCLTLMDVESLFRVAGPAAVAARTQDQNQTPARSLSDLPASVAAAIAAETRLMEAQN